MSRHRCTFGAVPLLVPATETRAALIELPGSVAASFARAPADPLVAHRAANRIAPSNIAPRATACRPASSPAPSSFSSAAGPRRAPGPQPRGAASARGAGAIAPRSPCRGIVLDVDRIAMDRGDRRGVEVAAVLAALPVSRRTSPRPCRRRPTQARRRLGLPLAERHVVVVAARVGFGVAGLGGGRGAGAGAGGGAVASLRGSRSSRRQAHEVALEVRRLASSASPAVASAGSAGALALVLAFLAGAARTSRARVGVVVGRVGRRRRVRRRREGQRRRRRDAGRRRARRVGVTLGGAPATSEYSSSKSSSVSLPGAEDMGAASAFKRRQARRNASHSVGHVDSSSASSSSPYSQPCKSSRRSATPRTAARRSALPRCSLSHASSARAESASLRGILHAERTAALRPETGFVDSRWLKKRCAASADQWRVPLTRRASLQVPGDRAGGRVNRRAA